MNIEEWYTKHRQNWYTLMQMGQYLWYKSSVKVSASPVGTIVTYLREEKKVVMCERHTLFNTTIATWTYSTLSSLDVKGKKNSWQENRVGIRRSYPFTKCQHDQDLHNVTNVSVSLCTSWQGGLMICILYREVEWFSSFLCKPWGPLLDKLFHWNCA